MAGKKQNLDPMCVFMTRDMLRTMAQENLMCSSRPTWERSLCLSMETRLLVRENRLRQTEEALVAERASRRTAKVAQQVLRACPAGVDVEEIGRLEMFSGDSDLNGRVSSMPWSQWSLTVRRYFGEFNQMATRLLQRVETNAQDPIITDNTTMTGAERRPSIQLYCEVTGLRHGDSCAGKLNRILR